MSRTPTRTPSPSRLAKELAAQARELGGSPAAALAVFARFLMPAADELAARIARLPPAAREVWLESLELADPPAVSPACDRDLLLAEIDRMARPVLPEGHLFELLLGELDRAQRRRRGVYYTPQPLASFVVQSAGRLVEQHFAGRPIHLIDPACGYGAFLFAAREGEAREGEAPAEPPGARPLVAAMQGGARPLVAAMQGGARPLDAAMQTGIELCPTTWAVAQLLLAPSPETPAPRLINANPLIAGEDLRELILGPASALRVPVIVGNPPWSNFGRQNGSPWMQHLLADYRTGLAERKANLADDAIKFIRWGQYWIDQAGAGILALVTPNTWLGGLTQRRMRQSLLESFDICEILDLHGETGGAAGDENVFGVRSGVAVVVLVRKGQRCSQRSTVCRVASIRGTRADKFARLAAADCTELLGQAHVPVAPSWRLYAEPHAPASDYASFWPLDQIFRHYISGVQTKHDAVLVGFTPTELERQVRPWLAARDEPVAFDAGCIRPYLVAPFDRRYVYYDPLVLGRARYSVMRQMLRPNLGLVFMRQSTSAEPYDHFLAVDCLVSDRTFYSRHGAPFLAPLWQEEEARGQGSVVRGQESGANFAMPFLAAVQANVGDVVEPLALFHYLYAVAHAPAYRCRYGNELRRGFPRFPLPPDRDSFQALQLFGRELALLHVSATPTAEHSISHDEQEAPFRVGGYDVLERWRQPRKQRPPTPADEAYLAQLAAIGREATRLMAAIDPVARAAFGWRL